MSQLIIDPHKTALVAIDLQNAVLRMNPVPHAAAEVVSNNGRISDVLRATGGLVVWVRVDINQAIRLPVEVPMPFEGKQNALLGRYPDYRRWTTGYELFVSFSRSVNERLILHFRQKSLQIEEEPVVNDADLRPIHIHPGSDLEGILAWFPRVQAARSIISNMLNMPIR